MATPAGWLWALSYPAVWGAVIGICSYISVSVVFAVLAGVPRVVSAGLVALAVAGYHFRRENSVVVRVSESLITVGVWPLVVQHIPCTDIKAMVWILNRGEWIEFRDRHNLTIGELLNPALSERQLQDLANLLRAERRWESARVVRPADSKSLHVVINAAVVVPAGARAEVGVALVGPAEDDTTLRTTGCSRASASTGGELGARGRPGCTERGTRPRGCRRSALAEDPGGPLHVTDLSLGGGDPSL